MPTMEMIIIANYDIHMGLHLDQVKFALWYKQRGTVFAHSA